MSGQQVRIGDLSRNRRQEERLKLVRRARLLAWAGLGWHGIEATVAIGAGIIAGSIALIGFGADSLVEAVAGVAVLWRFARSRISSESAERRARKLIGASYFLISAYVGVESVKTLVVQERPEASFIGICLSIVTLITMPLLARAKVRISEKLNSAALRGEGIQNMLCAYLSVALLAGLGANALFGWWWADPVAALVITAVAIREGQKTWRGEDCCVTDPADGCCDDECCGDNCCR